MIMDDFISLYRINALKKFSFLMIFVFLAFNIVNFLINVFINGNILEQIGYQFLNIYYVICVCMFIGLYPKEIDKKWKYLLIGIIIIYTIYTYANSLFYFGAEATTWNVTYCKYPLIGYTQTLTCTISCILVVLKKHIKLIDSFGLLDFIVGFIGVCYSIYLIDSYSIIHYVIFHMLWGLSFMFIYPDEGLTGVLCSNSVFGKSFSSLLAIVGITTVVLAIVHFFIRLIPSLSHFSEIYQYISLITLFAVVWIFIIFYASKLNKEDYLMKKELTDSNKYNEILLSEIHHRVKNNLGVIVSFVNIQKRKLDDPEIASVLNDVQNRVMAMSLLHSSLYETNEFSEVNFKSYVENLAQHIAHTFNNENVGFDFDILDVSLKLDVITPLGLIINEIIINSFKYGFPDDMKGTIFIYLKELGDSKYELIIGDTGISCTEEDLNSSEGIGCLIISSLISQIDGELTYNFENGLVRHIVFKDTDLVN